MAAIQKTSESTYIFLNISDNTLDDIDRSSHLDNQLNLNSQPPRYGLGTLEKLPLEIIHLGLIQLDIQSLTDFQRVNKRARLITTSIPQYKPILIHAPALLRGILNIQTARYFTCQDLYNTLSTAECDTCGDFGGYLYLITCRRVCFLCFTEQTDYLPLLRQDIIRKFGLDSKHIASLPRMKSFPGCYSPRGIKCRRRRQTLFDPSAARRAGIAVHGTIEAMETYATEMILKKLPVYQSRPSLCGRPDGSGMHVLRPPRVEDPFDAQCCNPRRFMGVMRAPLLRGMMVAPEWGFHCLACKPHHYGRPLHWRRMYMVDSFRDHVGECGEIVEGKHVPRMKLGE
ncbi:hypothetical protein BO78DRAFT_400088 [Aspergillus sclerotiicarbonarius CBS 121057]|uniref:F-box domain-containing protein n=1 Tax=Aspergillus sclerotiicarbonarius (strain CBS 121057 / IBT 28362) TaxID=1448318 RepID=A0A319DZD1_ASPSB|nr:hypothetical protein BO78DRAFT_400088 [Aspergillus sclerotiicarbonarius CBS 121057]